MKESTRTLTTVTSGAIATLRDVVENYDDKELDRKLYADLTRLTKTIAKRRGFDRQKVVVKPLDIV